MFAAVLSIAMLLTFAAAAEDTLTNAGTADLISAAAPESDTIAAHHDEHALDIFTDAPSQVSYITPTNIAGGWSFINHK